ncbi:MAG: glycoside hydrolase family 57 protein [Endomicrobiales bacterium]
MKKLHVAFLWHQHQPMYKNPSSGVYELPWVRLHATKDYYDMAAILDEFPLIKSNFNVVPSLLVQLNEYSQSIARDKFLDMTLTPADHLSESEKIFILHNFFMANWETMVFPYNRYHQLLEKRGRQTSQDDLHRIQNYFSIADMRDLQVWFNLSWMDPYWRETDHLIKYLFEKGRNFSEEDKVSLINKQLAICGMIVPKYKELQDRGQIEVSVTPFYHPILPLLCDTNNALESMPQIQLPHKRFQHKEDALIQIQKAVAFYERSFCRPPRGMWPSEGSVSDDIIPLLCESSIKWIATDEEILYRSERATTSSRFNMYKPYRAHIGDNAINMVFRDHALSDAIGFVYSKWDPKAAAADFMGRLHAISDKLCDSEGEHLVSVILDGENCWEYYANDGRDFLRNLYQALSNDETIETVTINDYLQKHPPTDTLKKLWAGSWINGNFAIWIGHQEDNTAWDYLYETRSFLAEHVQKNPDKKETPAVLAAWEKIYIAEGSDWNWWFGNDHSSSNDDIFDLLFRQNLIAVYELLGEKVPDYLHKSIKGIIKKQPTLEPVDMITPKIDGKVTNYFEWKSAGYYEVGHAGGSMHQVETVIKSFYYGFDLKNLYFRLDLNTPIDSKSIEEFTFNIIFLTPAEKELQLSIEHGGKIREYVLVTPEKRELLTTAAAAKIIECAVSLDTLQIQPEIGTIEFVITVSKGGPELERWPYQSSVVMPKPTDDFILKTWSV